MANAEDRPLTPTSPLVDAIGDKLRDVHRDNVAVSHASIDATVRQWLEDHEHDLSDYARRVLDHVEMSDDMPPALRDALRIVLAPEHQSQFFIAVFAVQGLVNQFVSASVAPIVQDVSNFVWSAHPSSVLSPDQLALAVLRNNVGSSWAANEATKSGLHPDSFAILVKNTGEPPGIMQLLEAFRRGFIDDDRLEEGVRQSRVRDEWIDTVRQLRYIPPSPSEVVAGAVESHLDDATARRLFEEAGFDPAHYNWFYETAGRPPGIVEMLQLLNRGLLTEDQVRLAIRESNIKNKYIDAILQMRVYLPPPRSIVPLLRSGAVSEDRARTLLADHGVQPADIDAYVRSAHHERTQAHKEIGVAQVRQAYEERLMSRNDAAAQIIKVGYTQDEASLILDIADHARWLKMFNALIARIHALYVRWKADRTETMALLDSAGIAGRERDDLLQLWDLEREANVQTLSRTQIQGALRRGVITADDARRRLVETGWHKTDLDILLAEAYPSGKIPAAVLAGG